MALSPARVRIVGKTSQTEWNQCHALCPPKLNRTAVGLTRGSFAYPKIAGSSPAMTEQGWLGLIEHRFGRDSRENIWTFQGGSLFWIESVTCTGEDDANLLRDRCCGA